MFDFKRIFQNVQDKGFYICKNMISNDEYLSSRKEALDYFNDYKKHINFSKPLRGELAAGMKNVIGTERNQKWYINRACFFPWNSKDKKLEQTINLSRKLSMIRNQIIGKNKYLGLGIENNNFVQYTSLSLYPKDGGFLSRHSDGHPVDNQMALVHFKLELTHKFQDYDHGGFYIWDNEGNEIDVSALVKPRDVIFFNGFNFHQIKPIKGKYGRIALFEIPTYVTPESREADFASDGESKFFKGKRRLKKILRKLISKL